MSPIQNPESHKGKADHQAYGKREPGSRWPEIVAAQVILVAFLVLSSLQVVSRYIFDAPLVWTEELSANLLIWMTFLGAAAIQRSDSHVRVEFVEEFFGPRVALWLFALFDAIIIVFLVALVIGGWQLMSQLEFERTPALRIPIAWIVFIVPAASVVMVGYAVASMVRRLRRLRGHDLAR